MNSAIVECIIDSGANEFMRVKLSASTSNNHIHIMRRRAKDSITGQKCTAQERNCYRLVLLNVFCGTMKLSTF